MEWSDENPYFLLLVEAVLPMESRQPESVQIDLGVSGWVAANEAWMRRPAWWYLCHKGSGQVALAMRVWEGEQPYYTRKHIGQINTGSGVSRETSCYGIGKKLVDGHVNRLWILPDGYAVCGGDDVEPLANEVIKAMFWSQP